MVPLPLGSCASKLEGVEANSIEVLKLLINIIFPPHIINTLALFAFTRFYLRVLADGNGIIRRLKRNVILRKAIRVAPFLGRAVLHVIFLIKTS